MLTIEKIISNLQADTKRFFKNTTDADGLESVLTRATFAIREAFSLGKEERKISNPQTKEEKEILFRLFSDVINDKDFSFNKDEKQEEASRKYITSEIKRLAVELYT